MSADSLLLDVRGAAKAFGGQVKLGDAMTKALGRRVSQQWISRVINQKAPIPAEWPLVLEQLLDGKFRRSDFRPDLYPPDEQSVPLLAQQEPVRLSA